MAWHASQLGDRELKESRTLPKIVSDSGRKDEEVWKRNGSEKASSERGVEIGCGTQRAYVHGSGDELLYSSPTALGSVSFSGRRHDTKPHSAGRILSNRIPPQPTHSQTKLPKNIQGHEFSHTITHRIQSTLVWHHVIGKQALCDTHSAEMSVIYSHFHNATKTLLIKNTTTTHMYSLAKKHLSSLSYHYAGSWFLRWVPQSRSISTNKHIIATRAVAIDYLNNQIKM